MTYEDDTLVREVLEKELEKQLQYVARADEVLQQLEREHAESAEPWVNQLISATALAEGLQKAIAGLPPKPDTSGEALTQEEYLEGAPEGAPEDPYEAAFGKTAEPEKDPGRTFDARAPWPFADTDVNTHEGEPGGLHEDPEPF